LQPELNADQHPGKEILRKFEIIYAALVARVRQPAAQTLAAELSMAPREVRTMTKWILGGAAVVVVAVALAAPNVGAFWCWTFG
jgi:hypothetical protein